MIDEKELIPRLDERYVKKDDCGILRAETDKRLDALHTDVAVIKTRLTATIAILSAIAVPVLGIAVKLLFGV